MTDSFAEFDASLESIHLEPFAKATGAAAPFTAAQMEAIGVALTDGILAQVLLAVANISIFGIKPFAGLQQWAIELETAASNALAAAEGAQGTADTANTIAAQIQADLTDFLSTGNWADLSAAFNAFVQWVSGTSTTPGLTGNVWAPSVTDGPQVAQPVSNFPNPASIQPGGGWSYDSTTSYNGSAGTLLYTATGAPGAMRGVVATVQPGQVVSLAAMLQWSGLTSSGPNPIQLQIIPWTAVEQPGSLGTVLVPGTAGTPVVVAQIPSPGVSATWTALSGTYTVPVSGVGFVQIRLYVDPSVTVGALINWAACTETISGGFLSVMKSGLGDLQDEAIASATAWSTLMQSVGFAIQNYTDWPTFAATVQTAYKTWQTTEHGIEVAESFTLQGLFDAMFNINPDTGQTKATGVEGVGGLSDLATTFNTMFTQLGAALGGDVADAGGLIWLAQLMNALGVQSNTASTAALDAATILAIVNHQPVAAGLEATVESNGDYHQAAPLGSALVAKTTSRGTCITLSQAKTLGFVQWFGSYSSAPTAFVINFYKMDSSGNLALLFSSPDLSATISSSLSWYIWDIPTANAIVVNAGDVIAVEFQIKTSGSVDGYGYAAPISLSHPTAAIKQIGFTQNWNGSAAATISSGGIGWSQYAPYIGLGVGTPPPTPFFPQSTTFAVSGTHTPASWANFTDLVGVGGAGGGEGETGAGNGDGGTGGIWGTTTLTVGVTNTTAAGMDIPVGGTITVTVGHGGAGGPYFTPGSNGVATTFSWVNMAGTAKTLTCAPGAGGQPTTNLTSWGLSPGNITYPVGSNTTYFGGNTNVVGGVGNYPAGGGTGGAAFQYGFAGAAGEAWTVDRQS